MKYKRLLLWFLLLMGAVNSLAAKEAYAALNGNTLKFYYDNSKYSRNGTTFDLNTGSDAPEWVGSSSSISFVVFDQSFADFRPTNCYSWFKDLTHLISITDIQYFKTDEVTDMSYMFSGCSNLKRLNLSNFNTANVNNMFKMFSDCGNLTEITFGNGFVTSGVTGDMSTSGGFCGMFMDDINLKSLDLTGFSFSQGASTENMLYGCSGLKRLIVTAAAGNFHASTCNGVGTEEAPCALSYPVGFTPEKTPEGDGWYIWKGGCFKDVGPEPYAVLSADNKTLTFYYDENSDFRPGTMYRNMGTEDKGPGWKSKASTVTRVVFDASFADCRPTSCYEWFKDMGELTTITGIGNLKTDEVTTMHGMFNDCSKLSSLDVTGFNTSKVEDMQSMFSGCSSLTKLNVSGFDTSDVNDLSYMFKGCSKLTILNVSGFVTSYVSNFSYMFYGCSGLLSLDVRGFHSYHFGYYYSMFEGCSSLRNLDLSNFGSFDEDKTDNMLKGCTDLHTLSVSYSAHSLSADACSGVGTESSPCDLIYTGSFTPEPTATGNYWIQWKSGYFNTPRAYAVLSGYQMTFYYDYSIAHRTGKVYEVNSGSTSPKWNIYNDQRDIRSVYFNSSFANYRPTTCYRWFSDFVSLKSIYGIENLNTAYVENMQYMFENCTSLETIDLSGFITVSATNMGSMFSGCSGLTSLDVSKFNTSRVTNMGSMFSGCSKLDSLDVTNFDTKHVEDMHYMFKDCSSLTSLDLSKFSTNAANNLKGMFSGCSGLTSISLREFQIGENDDTSELLSGCTGLNLIDLPLGTLPLNSDACTGVGSMDSPCILYSMWGYLPNDVEDIGGGLMRWKSGIFREKPRAYVLLTEDSKSLIFKYDSFYKIAVGTLYNLNESSDAPDWFFNHADRHKIERVIFNPSFAEYRPQTCHEWLFGLDNVTEVFYLENLKTDEVTNMSGMFYEIKDPGLDLSGFNTEKVTDMSIMFKYCINLLSVNVSSFNTSNVTNMREMFGECNSLLSLDLSSFDTSNVTNMQNMFYNCSSLTSLDLSSFTFDSSCLTSGILNNCSGLKKLFIPSTAKFLDANACTGVGTQNAPCELVCPSGFNLEKEAEGNGWFMWKGGYFKDPTPESYVVLDGTTLSFYHDVMKTTRPGMKFYLNSAYEVPGWSEYASTVTRVEFDPSFTKAYISSCYGWFNGMSNLTTISLFRNLVTGQVSNMASMFSGCSKLDSLDLRTLNFTTHNVTDMSDMFKGCSMLKSLKVGWFNTSKVTSMKNMFYGCSSLESLDVSVFNTELVTDMSGMFYGCSSLDILNLSNFKFNFTSSSTASQNFLKNCSGLRTLTIPETAGNLHAAACTGVGTQSEPCILIYPDGFLTHSGSGWYQWKNGYFMDAPRVYAVLDGSKLTFYYDYLKASRTGSVYELNNGNTVPGWRSSNSSVTTVVFDATFADARPTSCYYWFDGMYNLTTITGIGNLKTDEVTNMNSMFSGCTKLTSLDVSGFNTENVRDMMGMFQGCSGLTSLDVSKFNTLNVTSMKSMFQGCSGLRSLDVSGFNTDKVNNMESMFQGCPNLENIDVSKFNTSNVTNMPLMFYGCSSLTSLDVSGFDTESVKYMRSMFGNCSSLTSLDLSGFTFNNGTETDYFMYLCSNLKKLTIPETAGNLDAGACTGVGTQSAPCILIYPDGFLTSSGSGWFQWKSGYFTNAPEAYAVFNVSTLTFYYDSESRVGTVYELNTGGNDPGWMSNNSSVTRVVFDTSFAEARPTSCFNWFAGMNNLTTITGIGNLKTDEVTNMGNMFSNCSGLTSLDVSGFNTEKVTNMTRMFSNCSGLTSLDLSGFTFNEGIKTDSLLYYCSGLNTLTIPASAVNLNAAACTGVGTESAPCTLIYPFGFTPEVTNIGDGWYVCKGGYFKDVPSDSYAVLDGSTLTFYYDLGKTSRTGTVYDLNTGSNSPGWYDSRSSVTSVVFDASFANAHPKSCYRWFADMTNLTTITDIANLKTDEVTNMSSMFYNCSNLTSLDVGGFNTGKVTDMMNMFNGCSKLESLDVGGFNTGNVENMEAMFYNCSKLTSLDVGGFNTENVTDMNGMFYNCSSLTSLDVSRFSTENVTDMNSMFFNCSNLTSIDVSGFNTENVTNMGGMFQNCSSLTSLDLSSFTFQSEPVGTTSNMLTNCCHLQMLTIPATAVNFNATTCDGVGTQETPCKFVYPEDFTPVTTTTGDGWYMWKGGYFKDFVLNSYAVLDGSTLTFYHDYDMDSRTTPENVYELNKGYTAPGWFGSNSSVTTVVFDASFADARPTSCYYWFNGMYNLTTITGIGNLNTDEVTNMSSMFSGCTKLTSLDVSGFNTENVRDMLGMFQNCRSLTSLNVSEFNTSNVTSMKLMFKGCSGLTSIDVSEFDTEKVYNMESIFEGCSNLESIDVSKFNTSNVTNMPFMFYGCSRLTSLDVSGFDTENVAYMRSMFGNCSSLTSLDLSGFTFNDGTETIYFLYQCSNLDTLTIPETAYYIASNACNGVGTTSKPCTLVYPEDFSLEMTSINNNWFMWKNGYFKDVTPDSYAVLDGSTLTFYYDYDMTSRTGTVYELNTGNNLPGWRSSNTSVTDVVFDASFANARPTSCHYWFNGMTSLTTITGIENLKTDEVTIMDFMFFNCYYLTSIDVSGFNTEKVTNMQSMFYRCSSLTSLDVSGFNTEKVTNMRNMFYLCYNLSSLDLSSFTFNFTSSSTASTDFLYSCRGLRTLTIPETANNLVSTACTSVGTQTAPCMLIYPEGFTPETTSTGEKWYQWKGGYFKDALRGDANGDDGVSLIDVMITVDYILDHNPEGFVLANADLTGDGEISLVDLMGIVDIILTQPSASIPAISRESALDAVALTANGSRCTLHLDNSEPCRAISFTVILPEGGKMGNVSVPVSRADGHHALFNAMAPGRYNVVVYSNNGNPLRDGTTAMLRFDISGCHADDITISDIQMVNNWNETVLLPATYGITTGIAWSDDSDSDDNQPWYNTVGVGSSKPTRGVNIHNGKKTVVK